MINANERCVKMRQTCEIVSNCSVSKPGGLYSYIVFQLTSQLSCTLDYCNYVQELTTKPLTGGVRRRAILHSSDLELAGARSGGRHQNDGDWYSV